MNFILENSLNLKDHEIIHNFEVLSKAIHTILKIIYVRLRNEDKNPLSREDTILIREIIM
jgi:hypothetical protein